MLISEFLPNPKGPDSAGEWIELFNESITPVSLSGWSIKDASGKKFTFKNQTLGAGEFLTLDSKITKVSLNNGNEKIFLYNASGELMDELGFSGTAPEGKSVIRGNGKIIFTETPTPGKANFFKTESGLSENKIFASLMDGGRSMAGEEIVAGGSHGAAILIGLAVAVSVSIAAFLFLKNAKLLKIED